MKRSHTTGAVLLLNVLLLVGCAATPTEPSQVSPDESAAPMPEFNGPWAEEFRFRYGLVPDNEIRQMLADEEISDAEKQVVTARFRSCLANHQIEFDDFKPGGGYDFSFPESLPSERANAFADECSRSEGVDSVIHLYFVTRSNPNNEDMSDAIAACLVRAGLVGPGFTGEDYKQPDWPEKWRVDETQQYPIESRCQQDPEHAYSSQ